jgi:hypothetical protein
VARGGSRYSTKKEFALKKLRRIVSILVVLVSATIVADTAQRPAYADITLPVGAFHISNFGSGKCVEITPDQRDGNLFYDGNRVWQRSCDGSAQQSWLLVRANDGPIGGLGTVVRYFLVNHLTGKCLDLKDGNTADGAVIQQWTCNGNSTTMLWGLYDDFLSSRQLVNARSAKCLDVQGGSLQDLAWLQNYHCTNNNTAQHFYLS